MLASPLLGERLTARKLGCAVVALLGMVLVSGVLETGLYGLKGIILGLVSAVTYAVIVMLNKTLKDISAGDRTIMQLGISSIVMLPYVLLTENVAALDFVLDASDMAQIALLDTRKPLIDHQDPQRIKWFNERVAGESLK